MATDIVGGALLSSYQVWTQAMISEIVGLETKKSLSVS